MAAGIRFYNVIWNTGNGFTNTTEAAHSRRYLFNQIKKNDLQYFSESGKPWEMVKIQEIETPVIEIEVLDVKGDILAASTLTAEAEGSGDVMSW